MLGSPQQQAPDLQTFLNKLLKNNSKMNLKQNSDLLHHNLQPEEYESNCVQQSIKVKGVRGRKKTIPLSSTIASLNTRPFNVLSVEMSQIQKSNEVTDIESNLISNIFSTEENQESTSLNNLLTECNPNFYDNNLDANVEDLEDHLNVPSSSTEYLNRMENRQEATECTTNNKPSFSEASTAEASNSSNLTVDDLSDSHRTSTSTPKVLPEVPQNFIGVPNESNAFYLNYLKMLLASVHQQKQKQQQQLFDSNNTDTQNSLPLVASSVLSTPSLSITTNSNKDGTNVASNSYMTAAAAVNAIFPPGLSMFGFNIEQVLIFLAFKLIFNNITFKFLFQIILI